ncbi:MAG: polysaccharide deacetylase family protein [Oscillospiraceae bacterium]|nr:polysaccharide deacetylase family protein [Oscillospiraceae bacterium]
MKGKYRAICAALALGLLCSCTAVKNADDAAVPDNNQNDLTESSLPTENATETPSENDIEDITVTPVNVGNKKKNSALDPENTRGLSTKKIAHSYGVAKNGEAHEISKSAQKFFDDGSYKAFCLDTKSQEKVLYLTFDCGYENGYTAKILDVLKEKKVNAAFFCTLPQVKDNPDLIKRMIDEGHIVGNHSVTHPSFASITRTQMADEIMTMDNYLRENFNYSEPFFRFPMGEYSESALDLVGSLGFTSVFWSLAYADWDLNQQKGTQYAYETVISRLHPGAVILLHSVSPDNAGALAQIIDKARDEGYTFLSLRDYGEN